MRGEDDVNYETEWDVSIGSWMKGLLIDGGVLGWSVDESGEPHHDDIDPAGRYSLRLTNFDGMLDINGLGPPVESASDLLHFFSSYKNDSEIHINIELTQWPCKFCVFKYRGSVGALKTLFKHRPPPFAADYEDGIKDTEFQADYEAWLKSIHDKKTAREILGRGGREDVWQEDEADTSKSFSVYNPRKKRKRR